MKILMGLNAAANDTRVLLISLFVLFLKDSISAFETMLIGSVCQWVHSYLKCALAGFCSGFKI